MRITIDAIGAIRAIDVVSEDRRAAARIAINRIADRAKAAIIAEMPRVFDRPTRWTLGALRARYATPANLVASVWLRDRAGNPASKAEHYLYTQVFGGRRGTTAMETALRRSRYPHTLRANEYLVPTSDAPLDAHGNVRIGVVRQILSQLQAAEIAQGYTANVRRGAQQSAQSRRRQLRAGTFFLPRPRSGLPRGIYRRIKRAKGWETRMIYHIVTGRPRYRQRLFLGEIARRERDRHLGAEFAAAYAYVQRQRD